MNNITRYYEIPGFGDFDKIYKELISALPDTASILELGVAFGRGTWAMLDAMRSDMSLYVLDFFNYNTYNFFLCAIDSGTMPYTSNLDYDAFKELSMIRSHREMFLHCVSQHSKYCQLQTVYTMSSELYIEYKHRPVYDLVFLDGDHSYDRVKQELAYFKDCTVIAGHDYGNHTCPGVKQAVDEFMADHSDRSLRIFDDQLVFVLNKV